MFEFHISRQARDHYKFDETLFQFNGNLIFANFHAVRQFAQKINQKRDLVNFPEQAVKSGQINALGLIDEILHYVVSLYRKQKNPQVMVEALEWIEDVIGTPETDRALEQFTADFPPIDVYRKKLTSKEYLAESTEGISNRAVALEEMIMLWVANKNQATQPYRELFDDSNLSTSSAYFRMLGALQQYFDTQPLFGPEQQNLLDMLRAPAVAVPYSLTGQLEFIRTHWSELLGRYLYRLLSSLDLVKEEEKAGFMGPGPVPIPVYDASMAGMAEPERFSMDREWMPRLVVIAKNAYVWLDQLSKKYKQPIVHLNQIPDSELDTLAKWGFSGLWLIGLWERSKASEQVKKLCGNPEAVASAYSLDSYQIAWDLGGEEAYQNLRDRAWQRGIRLASDMVPNHMGIDSGWVMNNPDRFLSIPYSPYPNYSFNGPNLSNDPNTGIYLEDHYYDRSDAAVVFKRVDHRSGDTRFIYHGNDGTTMPWNDTAQLNYLNPEVREAVIQTILEVARRFPIIRFDAAMTLAKKHFQRLWFPEPGTGGAIPSRSDFAMTRAQFDAIMPVEFWREVVDRCAKEAPDTLLLAEAFWLMESYFVRTLGMHRVYNSAFMNMLRNEDNGGYRLVMKNTLEFDPEILKRFVNFMNNPDERTAVDQFGKGDKYFGICTLMATLPGLPMFGHGQVEGFSEKYGMEFRRAYWEEQVDPYLVERHEREIFPLLHKRHLFANVDQFRLYDFYANDGGVHEDVFAFSNGDGSEKALVVFNNRFADADGWINQSCNQAVRVGGEKQVQQSKLAENLHITGGENNFCIARDSISGLEYIRPSSEIQQKGLHLSLHAYQYFVFIEFREITDDGIGSYRHLYEYLNGRGVPSVQDALRELLLQPVQAPFRQIANAGYIRYLLENRMTDDQPEISKHLLDEAGQKITNFLGGIRAIDPSANRQESVQKEMLARLQTVLSLETINQLPGYSRISKLGKVLKYLQTGLEKYPDAWLTLFHYVFTHNLGKLAADEQAEDLTLTWIEEWQLGKIVQEAGQSMGLDHTQAWQSLVTLRLLVSQQGWFEELGEKPTNQILTTWLADQDVQFFLGVNRYQDILWFNHESYLKFIWWMTTLAIVQVEGDLNLSASIKAERFLLIYETAQALLEVEKGSGFQVAKLLESTEK